MGCNYCNRNAYYDLGILDRALYSDSEVMTGGRPEDKTGERHLFSITPCIYHLERAVNLMNSSEEKPLAIMYNGRQVGIGYSYIHIKQQGLTKILLPKVKVHMKKEPSLTDRIINFLSFMKRKESSPKNT